MTRAVCYFFEKIIFIKDTGEDHKYLAANKYNLDIVVDDGPHHISEYSKNFSGKVCIFHAPWNRSIQENNKKTYRVHDWNQFEDLLPKLSFTSPFRQLLEEIDTIE
jgi:5'(3')-deoxyribonucleotidase